MAHLQYTVPREYHNARLDVFLAAMHTPLSRSTIARLISSGYVLKGTAPCHKSNVRVSHEETYTLTRTSLPERNIAPPTELIATIRSRIIAETDHFFAINKPAGCIVHPTANTSEIPTLADAMLHIFPDIAHVGEEGRPGIVHRLDKDTTGIMLVAKTQEAYDHLRHQFFQRTVEKTYIALVHGHPPYAGRISTPIGRDPVTPHKMHAHASAEKCAETAYECLGYAHQTAHVKLIPKTGRTHQLRVHMAHIGHPLVGDTLYGGQRTKTIRRQALHAHTISFHFDDTCHTLTAPCEADIHPHLAPHTQ